MAKRNYSDSEMKSYFNDHNKRNGKKRSKGNKKKALLIILGVVFIIFIGFGIYIFSGLPSLEELENPKPQLASKVFTVDGELLGQFFFENRIETHIGSVPKYLVDALISTEDKGFYDHWGVDMSRFAKA